MTEIPVYFEDREVGRATLMKASPHGKLDALLRIDDPDAIAAVAAGNRPLSIGTISGEATEISWGRAQDGELTEADSEDAAVVVTAHLPREPDDEAREGPVEGRDFPPSGWRPSYQGDESWRGKGYNPGSGYDG